MEQTTREQTTEVNSSLAANRGGGKRLEKTIRWSTPERASSRNG